MTPEEFCKYVINGEIFNKIPSYEAGYAELGRYIWPDRYNRLVILAKNAVLTPAAPDSEGQCILSGKCEAETKSCEIKECYKTLLPVS